MKIIILEGPDGAGKTSLAHAVNHNYSYRMMHSGPPKKGENLFMNYINALQEAERRDTPTVFDRLHLGELVYGTRVRNKSQLGEAGVGIIERLINGIGAQVVLCLPPWRTCLKNWMARGDEYVKDLPTFSAVYGDYAAMLTSRTYLHWDFSRMTPVSMARMLATGENKRLAVGCVGSASPRFFILTDDALAGGRKGQALWDMLRAAGFSEFECAFGPECEPTDFEARPVIVDMLHKKNWDVVKLRAIRRNSR